MAMGICRQGSLSGGELGREIPSAVKGTVQLPFLNYKVGAYTIEITILSFCQKLHFFTLFKFYFPFMFTVQGSSTWISQPRRHD
ncbi:hypothetical protein Hanom_Chr11g01063101 [Helianthus anomalus]